VLCRVREGDRHGANRSRCSDFEIFDHVFKMRSPWNASALRAGNDAVRAEGKQSIGSLE
jgi:hypothetical protein